MAKPTIEHMKKILREKGMSADVRASLKDRLDAWEVRFTKFIADAAELFEMSELFGRDNYNETLTALKMMIGEVALTRDVFEGEAGFEDMFEITQNHLNYLIAQKGVVESALGTGAN